MKYKAFFTEENTHNEFRRSIAELDTKDLPQNGVLIKVHYSSLNYKDALSASGHKGITRNYPFQPGIDAAGVVVESNSSDIKSGDEVIVTGYDLGMNTPGGFGQYINVPAEWIVPLPEGLSLKDSMFYGTAGFTAAICMHEILLREIPKSTKPVLVTGATGGVGIAAVGFLSKLGYNVCASTGKPHAEAMLKDIGNADIISREDAAYDNGKPLQSAKWASVVDTVGGDTLAASIRSTDMHGIICCLGNVADDKFCSSVYPFLLRGVSVIGIDSASKNMELRKKLWSKIAGEWKIDKLHKYIKEVSLDGLDNEIDLILKGQQKGRVILNLLK